MATVVAIFGRAKCMRWVDGDSADMCARKSLFMSMGGRAEGLAGIDPGAMTPMGFPNLLKQAVRAKCVQAKCVQVKCVRAN